MREIDYRDYDKLSPIERFQLSLKALERDDEREVGYLKKTCPKKKYRENDAEFTNHFEALNQIMAAFLMQMEFVRGKLIMMEAINILVEELLKAVQVVVLAAYAKGSFEAKSNESPEEDCDVLLIAIKRLFCDKIVEGLEGKLQGELRGNLEMFDEVCNETMGLSSETVLKGWGADKALPWIDFKGLEQVETVKTDPGIKAAFLSCWERNLKE